MIGWYMNPGDLNRYLSALNRLEAQTKRSVDDLPRVQATDYIHLLHANVMNQKHMSAYPAYSDWYEEWKTNMGLIGKGYWRLYDSFLNNLTVWRTLSGRAGQRQWKAGIPAGVMDKGGTSWFNLGDRKVGKPKPIAMYARTMEFGQAGHAGKRRPIFMPTKEEYKNGKFVERGEEELGRLARHWR